MIQRGRKSAAGLALVVPIPGQRHRPPSHLSPDAAAEWRAIIAIKPAGWFTRDTFGSLEALCCHTVSLRRISAKIDAMEAADDPSAATALDRAYAQRERESRAVLANARSLRITIQAQRTAGNAGTEARKAAAFQGSRPWDK